MSVVVHPGVSNTNLFAAGPGSGGGVQAVLAPLVIRIVGQSDARGALPTLYGATSPDAQSGHFYGPDGFRQMRGYPVEVRAEGQAYDESLAARLWQVSEQLTGIHFSLAA